MSESKDWMRIDRPKVDKDGRLTLGTTHREGINDDDLIMVHINRRGRQYAVSISEDGILEIACLSGYQDSYIDKEGLRVITITAKEDHDEE